MKREDAIGLFGIAAWLLLILVIVAGQAGVFDPPTKLQAATPVAAKAPKAHKAPKDHWGLQEFFPLPTCSGGDIQATWRTCTLRYNA